MASTEKPVQSRKKSKVYLHEDRELPGIPSSGRNNPLHGRSERKAAGCRDSIESKALLKRAGFNADWTVDRELEMWSHRVPPRHGSDLREATRFPAVVLRMKGVNETPPVTPTSTCPFNGVTLNKTT